MSRAMFAMNQRLPLCARRAVADSSAAFGFGMTRFEGELERIGVRRRFNGSHHWWVLGPRRWVPAGGFGSSLWFCHSDAERGGGISLRIIAGLRCQN